MSLAGLLGLLILLAAFAGISTALRQNLSQALSAPKVPTPGS